MNFDVMGPFEVKRYGATRIITDEAIKDLEPKLEAQEIGLPDACGCYVFALRAGKGYTPYTRSY